MRHRQTDWHRHRPGWLTELELASQPWEPALFLLRFGITGCSNTFSFLFYEFWMMELRSSLPTKLLPQLFRPKSTNSFRSTINNFYMTSKLYTGWKSTGKPRTLNGKQWADETDAHIQAVAGAIYPFAQKYHRRLFWESNFDCFCFLSYLKTCPNKQTCAYILARLAGKR